MKKRKRNQDNRKFYRVNEQIRALTLRVLNEEGLQIGVLKKEAALAKAREEELDLVEVAPKATPPVARIVDYKKFLYQQEKKRREEKKKTKASETKEVRLGPFMEEHDLLVMIRRSREFLEQGNKVKLVLRFAGRQITHPEFGEKVIEKVIGDLDDISKIEREMHFEGRQLLAILSPERKRHDKEEDKTIGS
ncbi:translation initiation factor IF-3 [Patescibacteria group bacterium]|nr:translation initiation factor IF-3 [Patescibacteria group bacterium]